MKDPWTKPKGVGLRMGGWGGEVGESGSGKMEITVLEQNFFK